MGGSLTRYQYLSLAYFVTHGTWIDPRTKPNLVVEGDHASWNAFYNATTTAYEGFEKCDCYRSQKWDLKSITENRYYVAPHWNLYYIQAFGSIPSHGHWNPLVLPSTQPPFKRNASFMWEYDWPNTILNHVALLRPKPQWIVLNAGHWANDFNNPEYRTRVIQAIRDAGIKSIWKTTTYTRQDALTPTQLETDHQMCAMTTSCLNLSWTRNVGASDYWDGLHFKEPIYQRMNEQLFTIVGH